MIVRTWDNTGCDLLKQFLSKAPENQASWDQASQFLKLIEALSFGRDIECASFETDKVIAERAKFFNDFHSDYTSNVPVFFGFHTAEEVVRECAKQAAADLEQLISRDSDWLKVFRESSETEMGSKLGPESNDDEARKRDDKVHSLITGQTETPPEEIIKECIEKREGAVEIMLCVNNAKLKNLLARHYERTNWPFKVTRCICAYARILINSWYHPNRHKKNEITINEPAASRERIIRKHEDRLASRISQIIHNHLSKRFPPNDDRVHSAIPELLQEIKNLSCIPLTVPILIVLQQLENLQDSSRFHRMVDTAITIKSDGNLESLYGEAHNARGFLTQETNCKRLARQIDQYDEIAAKMHKGLCLSESEQNFLRNAHNHYKELSEKENILRRRLSNMIPLYLSVPIKALGQLLQRRLTEALDETQPLLQGYPEVRALQRLLDLPYSANVRFSLKEVLGVGPE